MTVCLSKACVKLNDRNWVFVSYICLNCHIYLCHQRSAPDLRTRKWAQFPVRWKQWLSVTVHLIILQSEPPGGKNWLPDTFAQTGYSSAQCVSFKDKHDSVNALWKHPVFLHYISMSTYANTQLATQCGRGLRLSYGMLLVLWYM